MKKSELVNHMQSTRAELEALLAPLTPAQLTTAGVAGAWSVKDLLAHIAWYQQQEAELFGKPSPSIPTSRTGNRFALI